MSVNRAGRYIKNTGQYLKAQGLEQVALPGKFALYLHLSDIFLLLVGGWAEKGKGIKYKLPVTK